MPSTYNGIGTRYHGKQDRLVRNAHCHYCSRFGPLESYDTRLWFVVLYIPVIPLGRKRIVDFCPSCTRHMAMDAAKYEQARQLQVSGGLERYRREATPEAALQAHGQLLAFHEYDQAGSLRSEALDRFADDAPFRAALAGHLRQASFFDEMVHLYREAHQLDPDLPEARAGVALSTMANGLLDESRQLLDHLEEPGAGTTADMEPLYVLAGKFAAAGRHAEALELHAVLLRELPHLGQRPDFRDQVRRSEKLARRAAERIGDVASLLPGRRHSLKALFAADGSTYTTNHRNAVLGGLAAVLALVGLLVSNESIRRNRTIHVVNAGDPVEVCVDDGPPQSIAGAGTLHVAEGRHRITVAGPVPEALDVDIRADYFDRWLKSPAWVLNPGREAVFERRTVTYASPPVPSQDSLIVGESFLDLPNIDYLFTDPPASMRAKRNRVVTKEALLWARDGDLAAFHQAIAADRRAALDFAEKRLRRRPEDKGLFDAYLARVGEGDDRARADAFLQAGLRRKPLSIPWHRAAQVFATADERRRLTADYDAALAAEPNSAALLYLRGRIEGNLDRRDDYYRRSLVADPNLPWPVMSLGMLALARGDWREALDRSRQADALHADPDSTAQAIHTARLALGEAGTLVEEYRSRLGSTPFDLRTLALLFDALAVAGRPDEIEPERASFENRIPFEHRGQVAGTIRMRATYCAARPEAIDQFVQH